MLLLNYNLSPFPLSIKSDQILTQTSHLFSCFCTHSAIIEHTNKVLYLEDDDVAVVSGGKLSIHRINRQAGEDPVRAVQTLQMEMQQIMKGQTVVGRKHFVYMSNMKTLPCFCVSLDKWFSASGRD